DLYLAEIFSFERATQLKSVGGQHSHLSQLRPRPYKRRELQRFREELDARFPLLPATGPGSQSLRSYLRRGRFNLAVRRHARRLQLEAQVALALEAGLRLSELFHITMGQVHYENGAIVVITAKTRLGQRRERAVPWTEH